jgi:hypothetical protein
MAWDLWSESGRRTEVQLQLVGYGPPWLPIGNQVMSDYADVLGFFALFAGRGVELDALTLFEALVAITLDAGEMYENVVTLLARDEAESLLCVEKFYCALCHEYSIPNARD